MYLCVHNESELCLNYDTGLTSLGMLGNGTSYIEIAGCERIVFYYEVEKSRREYTKYFKEVYLDEIKFSDLFLNFKNNKIIVEERKV